jgi:hypothetical protein
LIARVPAVWRLPGASRLASLVAVLAATLAEDARASSTIYRCGPQGRVFSDQPCADGHRVRHGDARTAEQVQHAREIAQREAAAAQRIAQENEAMRREGMSRGATGLDQPKVAEPAPKKPKKKPAGKPRSVSPTPTPR